MRTKALTLLASAALVLGGCEAASEATLADAEAAFAANEFGKSRVMLHSLIDQEEPDPAAKILLVETLIELSDGYVAERYLNQIAESDLEPIRRLELMAQSLIVQGKPEAAIERMTEAGDRAGWTDQTYSTLLWAHLAADTLEANEGELVEAVNRFPDSAAVNGRAAEFFKTTNEWDKVEAAVGFTLESDPSHYDARLLSGELAIRQMDLAGALPIYQAVVEDYPDEALPKVNVVGLQLDLKQTEDAETTLTAALARHPDVPLLKFQEARLLYEKGEYRESSALLQRLAGSLKRYTPAIILSAQVDLALGNREIARAQLATAARDERFAEKIEQIMREADLAEL